MAEQAEVVVVGMGPGGEQVAEDLAEAGLDVVGIEGELVGGECPYWGCVPSKMMVRAGDALAEARRVSDLAGTSVVQPSWAPVARRIRQEATDQWDDAVAVERFESKGGHFVRGWGRCQEGGQVTVGDRTFRPTRALVLAAGSRAWIPPIPGLADAGCWTNRQAIEATEVPSSLGVIGGGAIGVELAQVFGRFGAEVFVVETAPRLVPAEEPEAAALMEEVLSSEGIRVLTGRRIEGVRRDGDRRRVRVEGGEEPACEQLLVATGRRADLKALGVGALGLDETARQVPVDGRMRAAPGVWAVGDITGKGGFTHVAVHQARIATADILGRPVVPADYRAVPRVTYTDPELGSVGLPEAAARQEGLNVAVGASSVPSSTRGWIHKVGNQGLVKLVQDVDRRVLVGATWMGPCGGEVLAVLTLAVHARVPTDELRRMIYAYPTFHRSIEAALADLGE